MALFLFTEKILKGEPIDVYNHGRMRRDFTYIDDIVQGLLLALEYQGGFEIINLGNSNPVELMRFIEHIEEELEKKASIRFLPIQAGDVPETIANIEKARNLLGYNPKTSIKQGVQNFVRWYKEYYHVSK
jgi:UDP-glucuronate 4-epimerase